MKKIYCFILLTLLGSCKDKYNAPVHVPAAGYLVVEGFINAGNGSTDFTLSRTTGLDSPYVRPEPGALITVESESGDSYPLTEQGNGAYSISQVAVDFNRQYRVRIRTANGGEYLSDLCSPKFTPPIDSISWKPVNGGVWIYVTTHDPADASRFYQWKYDETWEYGSAYISSIEYSGSGQFTPRPDADMIHICYMSNVSTAISVGSTEKLTDDVMYEFPLVFLPYATSNKLERKYSILVKQYVLNKEWYEWKEKLKKNTEELGSIFDPQPSDLSGNFHCISNPGETVIGYTGCSSETEKRIFISRSEIPPTYVFTGYEDCTVDTVKQNFSDYFDNSGHLPISPYYLNGFPAGYLASSTFCVDCRVMGGVLNKPPFWQ